MAAVAIRTGPGERGPRSAEVMRSGVAPRPVAAALLLCCAAVMLTAPETAHANTPPTSAADVISTPVDEGGRLTIAAATLLTNDVDDDGDTLFIIAVSAGDDRNETVTLAADGQTVTYAHGGSETTSGGFTYTVSDRRGGKSSAVVTVTIRPVNDKPVAHDDVVSVEFPDPQVTGSTATIPAAALLGNDEDAEGGALTIVAVQGAHDRVKLQGADISYTLTYSDLVVDRIAVDRFSYTIRDPDNAEHTATATLVITRCGRTPQVQYAIFFMTGTTSCTEAEQRLNRVKVLALTQQGIRVLQPDDFAGLTELTELRLRDNNLRSLPEGVFAGLNKLKMLDLSDNAVTSLSANAFAGLTSLEDLRLNNMDLKELPQGIFTGLVKLRRLYLHRNDLTVLPHDVFADLDAIDDLRLRDNQLRDLDADLFAGRSTLTNLEIGGNALKRLPKFNDLGRLTKLNLFRLPIESLATDTFAGLGALQSLNLADTRLTTLPNRAFSHLPKLETLDLSGSLLASFVTDTFAGLGDLRSLNLADTRLTTLPNRAFSHLPKLETLDLSGSLLASFVTDTFAGLGALKSLSLADTRLTTLPNRAFSHLPKLETLDLSGSLLASLEVGAFDGSADLTSLDARNVKGGSLLLELLLNIDTSPPAGWTGTACADCVYVQVLLPHGAPYRIEVTLSMNKGPTPLLTAIIPAGGVASDWLPVEPKDATISLQKPLPPTGIQGVAFAVPPAIGDRPTLPDTADRTYSTGKPIADLVLPEASGGNPPLIYDLVEPLPPGLRFDPGSRTVSGAPTAPGRFPLTWRATDRDGDAATLPFTITVHPDISPSFGASTASDQTYVRGKPIADLVLPEASGGNPPLIYDLVEPLPPGLRFDPGSRTVSGAPTAPGRFPLTWRATDRDGDAATLPFTITVHPDISPSFGASTASDQAYVKGRPIADLVLPEASGGNPPLIYDLVEPLPPGLRFDPGSRTVSGAPTAPGRFPLTWRATDRDGDDATLPFTITVHPDSPSWLSTHTYSFNRPIPDLVLPSGADTGPTTYVMGGTLPQGLRFDAASRTVSGIPTALGSFPLLWSTTYANGQLDSLSFHIFVEPDTDPTIPTLTDTSGTAGTPIADLVLPEPTGDLPLTYAVSPLPAGLSFDPDSRTISGIPTTAGTFRLTYRTTDRDGDTTSEGFDFTIVASTKPFFSPETFPDQRYIQGWRISSLTLPTATDGTARPPAFTYRVYGSWPAGLRFDAASRTVSGTPTALGSFSMEWSAIHPRSGKFAGLRFSIMVEPDTHPSFTTTPRLPSYTPGRPIVPLVLPKASGGNLPLTYAVSPLPAGLRFDPDSRTVSGTPTAPRRFSLLYRATDRDGDFATARYRVQMGRPTTPGPFADAGDDRNVAPGRGVILDGTSSSHPDGKDSIGSYVWKQDSGTEVLPDEEITAIVAFTAPDAATKLRFTLTVTDTAGNTDADTVTVSVDTRTMNICDRTPAVRRGIMNAVPATDCSSVYAVDAADIRTLILNGSDTDTISTLLPGDFDGLTNLRLLSLAGNDLQTLPAGIFDPLRNLEHLSLASNRIRTLSQGLFMNLGNLVHLTLHDNDLQELQPGTFAGLTKRLNRLLLSDNEIASLPAGIFDKLTGLASLSLHSNRLTHLRGLFDKLRNLRRLQLYNNQLTTLTDFVFTGLQNLGYLDLRNNGMRSLRAGIFDTLGELNRLRLSGNELSNLETGTFHNLDKLEQLELSDNDLSELPPGIFRQLGKLRILLLRNNKIERLPSEFFVGLTSLTDLDLRDNAVATRDEDGNRVFNLILKLHRSDADVEDPGPAKLDVTVREGMPFTGTFTLAGAAVGRVGTCLTDTGELCVTDELTKRLIGGAATYYVRNIEVSPAAEGVAIEVMVKLPADGDRRKRFLGVRLFEDSLLLFDSAPSLDREPDRTVVVNEPMAPIELREATGGSGTLTYTLIGLPTGLTFDAAKRTVSGTPTILGRYPVTYRVTDLDGDTAAVSFHIIVGERPTLIIEGMPEIVYNPAPFGVTLRFSEAVTDFHLSDLAATNAALHSFMAATGAGDVYTVIVAPDGRGDIELRAGAKTAASKDTGIRGPPADVSAQTKYVGLRVLVLTKTVTLCDAAGKACTGDAGEAYPGDVLQYEVSFDNATPEAITKLEIHDKVPSYTSLFAPAACPSIVPSGTRCELESPGNTKNTAGYRGPLRWKFNGSLPAAAKGSVFFVVRINH